ncbi:MAG: isoprenylcysteine carboxylmethyltransferase family protein [Anaerolineae bacterium]|nr:isoprenylcysteine carboxylmethyltransferase family protein [Anaerolineae bacterium]
MVSVRFLTIFIILSAILFLSAGTFAYWEAVVYLAIVFIPMLLIFVYLLRTAPDLLERRMRLRERETAQKQLISLSYLYFLVIFLLPGFDRRFEWSDVPAAMVLVADALVLVSFGIVYLVFRENRYSSHVVEVEAKQTVISSGSYSVVRHPMYVGNILMYVFSPLALGSYWATVPALLIIPLIVARITNEEKVLVKELGGYQAYMEKIRYRLVPGIW